MEPIHDILDEIAGSDEAAVLATVIHVEGSAYRKEGTTMLFLASGRQIGIISAGCLETDLAIQATNLLQKDDANAQTIVYDMSAEDDLSWGRGAGCNGKVHILLEKVHADVRKQLCKLREYLQQGTPVAMLKTLQDPAVVRTVYVSKDQHIFGNQDAASNRFIRIAQNKDKPRIEYVSDLKANVYIQHFQPKPRLFIFGAGPDVAPFASIASQTGFSITIWDWRPANLNQDRFPDANLVEGLSIPEIRKKMDFFPTDAMIIMTHDFQKDKELLHHLPGGQDLRYFGILGPRKRTIRLLDGRAIPKHLHSPVGLSIGAEGPEEIAVSIIADVILHGQKNSDEKRGIFEETRDNRHLSGGGEKQKV